MHSGTPGKSVSLFCNPFGTDVADASLSLGVNGTENSKWCFRFVDRGAVRISSTEEINDDSGNNQTVHDVSNVAFQNQNGQLVVQVNKMTLPNCIQVFPVLK